MNHSSRCPIEIRRDSLIAECYATLCEPLRRYAESYICNRTEAEDLVQDVFIRLLDYNTLLNEQSLHGLVYRIARNLITDHFRRNACRKSAAEYFSRFGTSVTRNTEETVSANELLRIEQSVFAAMPPRKAQVYMLYVHENRSAGEISARLNLSRRTVENHIFSARCDLRKALACAV